MFNDFTTGLQFLAILLYSPTVEQSDGVGGTGRCYPRGMNSLDLRSHPPSSHGNNNLLFRTPRD